MFLIKTAGGDKLRAIIEPIEKADFKKLTRSRFAFNWKAMTNIYKLSIAGQSEILGVISILAIDKEERIEIKLLAVSKENVGPNKTYERIAGNLIAFVAKTSVLRYGANAAISLIPKTELGQHYMNKYGFEQAGRSLFLEGEKMINIINEFYNG
jgi:hypothetical protein